MNLLKQLKNKKDARLYFKKNQPIAVRCSTDTCPFEAKVQAV
jgi:hypothetical protein